MWLYTAVHTGSLLRRGVGGVLQGQAVLPLAGQAVVGVGDGGCRGDGRDLADADGAAFQGRYARARQGAFDGNPGRVTEMDALVAYLQMLGTLVDFRDVTPAQLRQ